MSCRVRPLGNVVRCLGRIGKEMFNTDHNGQPKSLDYNIDDHVAGIEKAVFDNIKTPVTLVCHSMGAMIPLRLSL